MIFYKWQHMQKKISNILILTLVSHFMFAVDFLYFDCNGFKILFWHWYSVLCLSLNSHKEFVIDLMFYLSLIYILCLSLLYILSFVWCSVYLLFHIVFLIWFRDCFSLVTSIICHRYTCMCFTLILCTVCHWFHVLFVIGIMYGLSLVSRSVCYWFHVVFVIGFMWCVSLICVACLSLVSCGVWNWFMFWWFVICFRKCMSLAS